MYRLTGVLLMMSVLVSLPAHAEFVLVKDGQARSVIVLDDPDAAYLSLAARELQAHVQQASGAVLPILTWQQARDQPEAWARIHVGPDAWTRSAGLTTNELAPEQYLVKAMGQHLVFLGHDVRNNDEGPLHKRNSPATFWAVGHFLDRQLGVRWLWPGKLGTHVPECPTIAVDEMSVTQGPHGGIWREFVTNGLERARQSEDLPRLLSDQEFERIVREARLWKKRHQMAIRVRLPFGHAFNEWWNKYGKEHPDFFAAPHPDGPEMPWPRANRVKLRQGNPAVVDQIVQEWREGDGPAIWGEAFHQPQPDFWGVAPTDGTGFCTHITSHQMDEGSAVDAPLQAIWEGQINLTPRYVKFWKQILNGIHQERPSVTLCTYAYGPYTTPPTSGGVDFNGKLAIGIINDYWDPRGWQGWDAAGARLFLRPNWWCTGAGAPHLPLHMQGEYAKSIYRTDIIGYHYDGMSGHWATQGALYYLNARLAARPDLSVDKVIGEYVSAFDEAAPVVREYLAYWENFDKQAAMGVIEHPGGWEGPREDGLYEKIAKKHELLIQPIVGSYLVLPYLFTDRVLTPAGDILDRAEAQATDDPLVHARIAFLRDGLTHTALTRDVIKYAYGETEDRSKHKMLVDQLKQMRRRLSLNHAVWGPAAYRFEWRRRIATPQWHRRWDR